MHDEPTTDLAAWEAETRAEDARQRAQASETDHCGYAEPVTDTEGVLSREGLREKVARAIADADRDFLDRPPMTDIEWRRFWSPGGPAAMPSSFAMRADAVLALTEFAALTQPAPATEEVREALEEAFSKGDCAWTVREAVRELFTALSAKGAQQQAEVERWKDALAAVLARRSQPTMDPPYTAAFNAALDMVGKAMDAALTPRSAS